MLAKARRQIHRFMALDLQSVLSGKVMQSILGNACQRHCHAASSIASCLTDAALQMDRGRVYTKRG